MADELARAFERTGKLSVAISHLDRPRYTSHTIGNQPHVALLDGRHQIRSEACLTDGTCYDVVHEVTALIYNNPGCSPLYGTNIVETVSLQSPVCTRLLVACACMRTRTHMHTHEGAYSK